MKVPPHILDEIRARLPVSEVVGRRVKLRRQGREFAGLSPFNPEKTPSFFVNDQKGFYHCFSSGKHGDQFRFLMETEGLTFPEAVERLAAETGVTLPRPDAREEARERQRASLADVVEMAARFYEDTLKMSAGAAARAYVERRRLEPRTVKEFRIGCAPAERDGLKRHLLGKGVDEAAMIDAGLIIQPEDGRPSYDRFRNRLMIPIQDDKGRVIAFGGRAMAPDDQPKYLNSPETELFHKGLGLFNGHRAKAAAYDQGTVVVVEGYLDAIAVWQAGMAGVVATLGTAFTEEQIQRMWRFAAEPLVCFDGDKAGIKAAHRSLDRILPHLKSGFSFNFVFLPDGKDPDELIQLGGRAAFEREIARAVPLADVLWDRETREAPIDTPERKAALEKRLDDLVREIRDGRVQRAYQLRYRLRLSNLFWTSERRGRDAAFTAGRGNGAFGQTAFGQGKGNGRDRPEVGSMQVPPMPGGDLVGLERVVLGLCVEFPDLFEAAAERIVGLDFALDQHEAFKRELYRMATEVADLSVSSFYEGIDPRFFFLLKELHGEEVVDASGRVIEQRGDRLRERFQVLKFHPPETYVETCFWHFLDRIELRQMERELKADGEMVGTEIDQRTWERVLELTKDIARRKEEFARREQELAEEAKEIRAVHGPAATGGIAVGGIPTKG
ncbi:DNA primase [Siculibacillus lacustris]|uniref:DNA primase n=1 Tax=Siculibacillus lacustris TaxID=1549641 RepID=A0A4Q9VPI4_9HYPH|nr:DNA primase [Siculibacillus lacustris]TBW37648.1 DNA primase [Siculibacillus lacustris]